MYWAKAEAQQYSCVHRHPTGLLRKVTSGVLHDACVPARWVGTGTALTNQHRVELEQPYGQLAVGRR